MMAVFLTRQFFRKLWTSAWRNFSFTMVPETPYWHSKFPDGKPRSFEEIPLIQETNFEVKQFHEVSKEWFKKYGHVAKRYTSDTTFCVHLFHFEDFWTVYLKDGEYPIRKSHRVMKKYREERKDLYDSIGLGAGEKEDWWQLRQLLPQGVSNRIFRPFNPRLEGVADDLVKMLHIKANEGEIDMLSWLFRWAYESIGVVVFSKRLGALEEFGMNEEADKMVEAAGITNELIALSETDYTNFDKYYEQLVPAQDYMYSVISRYITEAEDHDCLIKTLLTSKGCSKKHALTLTMDIIQGALQTVPLTVLMGLYNVARNKQVQLTARAELAKVMPNSDSKYFDVVKTDKNVPLYIKKIVYETLRLNPPIIGNGRVIQNDMVLGGYKIPAGTNVILHNQVACLLEENFDEPLKFIPERHYTRHTENIDLVFGATRRTCFGKRFAHAQMALVFSKILKEFHVSYNGEEIKMINRLHNEPEKTLFLGLTPLN